MKLIRLAGIGEIILAAILGAGAYLGINDQKPLLEQISSNEFSVKTMGIVVAALLIIRLLVGLIGLIGKGRGLCLVGGLILLAMSAPDVISWIHGEATLFQMIFQGLAALFALLFFIGAFFVGRKPKVTAEAEGTLEGTAPTESIPANTETADTGFAPIATTKDTIADAMDSVQTTAGNVVDNAQIPVATTRDTITDVMDSVQTTSDILVDNTQPAIGAMTDGAPDLNGPVRNSITGLIGNVVDNTQPPVDPVYESQPAISTVINNEQNPVVDMTEDKQ